MSRRAILSSALITAICLCCIVATSAVNGAPDAPSPQISSSQERATSCLAAASPSWSPPEQFVWQSLCSRGEANLSEPGAGPPKNCDKKNFDFAGVSQYEKDPRRLLRGEFLQQIFMDEKYAQYLHDNSAIIIGAHITPAVFDRATIQSLRIINSFVDGFAMRNVKKLVLSFWCSRITGLNLRNVSAPLVYFNNVEVGTLTPYGASGALSIEGSTVDLLDLFNVKINLIELPSSHFIDVFMNSVDAAQVKTSSPFGLLDAALIKIFKGKISQLVFGSLDVAKSISVANIQWQKSPARAPNNKETGSLLSLNGVSAQKLDYAPLAGANRTPVSPDTVIYDDNNIAAIFLGDDPLALLRKVKPEQVELYAVAAKTHAARGYRATARQLYYQKNVLEDATEYNRFYMLRWVSRVVFGYGYYPQRGFVLLLGFVIVGWPIFATGEHKLIGTVRPRSWLIFSLDTMIPILELDPKHADVSFSGSRQYYLYFMRLLGAGLAFLVFAYLKQVFFGAE